MKKSIYFYLLLLCILSLIIIYFIKKFILFSVPNNLVIFLLFALILFNLIYSILDLRLKLKKTNDEKPTNKLDKFKIFIQILLVPLRIIVLIALSLTIYSQLKF